MKRDRNLFGSFKLPKLSNLLSSEKEKSLFEQGFHLPGPLPEDEGKLCVVLDLDETLIHTESLPANLPPTSNHSSTFSSTEEEKQEEQQTPASPREGGGVAVRPVQWFETEIFSVRVKVNIRPGLDDFLKQLSQKYEVICFTSALQEYGEIVMDRIDPKKEYFRHRLFRQHCVEAAPGRFVKDLRIVNRPLERIVLVDDNPTSFVRQFHNGLPIMPFIEEAQDTSLWSLLEFLGQCASLEDIRPVLRERFNLEATLSKWATEELGEAFFKE